MSSASFVATNPLPSAVMFCRSDGQAVLTIHRDGRLEAGAGLSDEEATQGLFDVIARVWPHFLEEWAKNHSESPGNRKDGS